MVTPERVSLGYDLAGLGSRAAAAVVDVTIQALLWLALLIVFGVVVSRFSDLLDAAAPAVMAGLLILVFLGGFFLLWGYYLVFEIIWSGQTPGKRALGLRVIRENGYPIRPGDAVVRNLVRIIDGPPFAAVVGALVMLLNERSKRLGDFAAGTIVVREGKRLRLADVVGNVGNVERTPLPAASLSPERAAVTAPVVLSTAVSTSSAGGTVATASSAETARPVALRPEDATLVRDFLVRRGEMDTPARTQLARRLADHVANTYGLTATLAGRRQEGVIQTANERFLEELVSAPG